MRDHRGAAIPFVLVLLVSCSTAQGATVVDAGAADGGAAVDQLVGAKALFEHRLDATQLDQAITQLDAMTSPEATLLAARAHLFRARAFRLRKRPLEKDGGLADLEKARTLSLRAWEALQPGVSSKIGTVDLESTLTSTPATAVPAIVYRASADWELSRWSNPVAGAMLLREVRLLSARAVELQPDFELATPLRLHAIALALLPGTAGGDFVQARFEFEKAIALAPNSVANRLEEAARWSVKAQNLALFRALLLSALKLDAQQPAEFRPEQLLARAQVLALLRRERELFGR
jgi:hypothetical protein